VSLERLNIVWKEFESIADQMTLFDEEEGYVDPAIDNEKYEDEYFKRAQYFATSYTPVKNLRRIKVRSKTSKQLHSLLIFRLLSYTTKDVAYLFSNYFVSLHMSI